MYVLLKLHFLNFVNMSQTTTAPAATPKEKGKAVKVYFFLIFG
jgi:hypothetical protein